MLSEAKHDRATNLDIQERRTSQKSIPGVAWGYEIKIHLCWQVLPDF
jgi:hypothetical protein